jgi:transposase-like protein
MKYGPEIIATICDKVSSGKHSVAAICKQVGITEETFYAWKRDPAKSEFSEALKKAEKEQLSAFRDMARTGLAARLMPQEVTETHLVLIDSKKKGESVPKVKEKKVITKTVQPSDLLIMFTLKNQDSENFKDKQEISGELSVRTVRATIRRGKEGTGGD